MFVFLKSLICGIWSLFVHRNDNAQIDAGRAFQEANDAGKVVNIQNAEMEAAANAPSDKESLIEALHKHKICLALLILPLLTNCADNVTYGTACPVPRVWSPMQQDEIAANLSTLLSDSPLIAMGVEWARLRAESNACLGQVEQHGG